MSKENKVFKREDGIIEVDFVEAKGDKDIMNLLDELIGLIKESSAGVRVLLNIKTTSIIRSSSFRKEVGQKFKGINPKIRKAAMCGGNALTRTIANFIIAASDLKNIRIFVTEKEALEWLKEK